MKKFVGITILSVIFTTSLVNCNKSQAVVSPNDSLFPQPTVSKTNINASAAQKTNTNQLDITDNNLQGGNEIKSCTPEKLYRGDTLNILFAENHGGKMLIYREPRENFYFLDTGEDGTFPKLTEAEIKKLSSLELNTESTLQTNFRKTDSSGNYVIDRVFNKTGWYQVNIGHQALDVDFIDMPVTGSCRVYYVNKKRSSRK